MGQNTTISSDMMIKYGSVICLIVFGSIILFYLISLLFNKKSIKPPFEILFVDFFIASVLSILIYYNIIKFDLKRYN